MDLNASLVAEVEAYFARNEGRDRAAVRNEVFAILDAVYVRREFLAGEFVPATPAAGCDDSTITLLEDSGSATGGRALSLA